MDKQSYTQHNSEYVQSDKFEIELNQHKNYNQNNYEFIYQDDLPHGKIFDSHDFKVAVDVGSGTGWFANYVVEIRGFEKVYAIEPSKSATEIAKKIYPEQKNVEWICGFAEEEISKLDLNEPTFFSFMCVLAHMENELAIKILESIDSVAPSESLISFSEPYGKDLHQYTWHVRPENWWRDVLPNWDFTFESNYIIDSERRKGFVGIKR